MKKYDVNIKWCYGAKSIWCMWYNSTTNKYYSCFNIIRGDFYVCIFTKDGDRFIPESLVIYTTDEFQAFAPEEVVDECIRLYS